MKCRNCNQDIPILSSGMPFCHECLTIDFEKLKGYIESIHGAVREQFGLPPKAPRGKDGLRCNLCINECEIPDKAVGLCGTRHNENNSLKGGFPKGARLSYYYDPIPTNCCAAWFCPATNRSGYPCYSIGLEAEYGYKNLSVFYHSCTFNCLFCQNWQYRNDTFSSAFVSSSELVANVDDGTTCICYFGGDPTPQIVHALKASKLAMNKKKIIRICWETNGSANPKIMEKMAELSLKSGGIVKFDLKAYNKGVHKALTGVSNKRTLENFRFVASLFDERQEIPIVTGVTLMTPGYVTIEEIEGIASFIASIDARIPYSLLVFHPQFFMKDLPITPREFTLEAYEVANAAGLENVHIGNTHLLL